MTRRLLAEFIGTFFLVLAGPGAIMVEGLHPGAIGPLGIALAFGLIVGGAVLASRDLWGRT